MPKIKTMFGDNPKLSFFLGLFVGVAVFSTAAALVLVIAMFSGNSLSFAKNDNAAAVVAEAVDEPTEEAQEVSEVPPVTSADNVYGPDDAKVTLIEYSDFECPYCARFHDTISQIIDEYGDDVRVVFRHFPLSFHANALGAAIASECAAEQGEFWKMHDKIFEANVAENMSLNTWKEAAEEIGLNMDDFEDCLVSDKYDSKIASQMEGGAKAGVRGTPATFVNGTMVSGAYPFESFQQIIDAELQ